MYGCLNNSEFSQWAQLHRKHPQRCLNLLRSCYPRNRDERYIPLWRVIACLYTSPVVNTSSDVLSKFVQFSGRTTEQADACFYRGGLFNWFEGGPVSSFLNPNNPGFQPVDGDVCQSAGRHALLMLGFNIKVKILFFRYCSQSTFYPCGNATSGDYYKSCYFGRGAIQISYNFNYGQFQDWLKTRNINVDLLANPNLLMTKTDPPLALLASLWFYMTPQPPKPAMHDIILGQWQAGKINTEQGYSGPIFGPTSLIINNGWLK